LKATSIVPEGPSKLAVAISIGSPDCVYIQQNQGGKIRISANSTNSGKSIWISEHDYGIELTLSGRNIKRYKALVEAVLGRVNDTDADTGGRKYLNWREVDLGSIRRVVSEMNDY
jgi:hypothetical protein